MNPVVNDIYTMRMVGDETVLLLDSETDYDHNGVYEGARESRTEMGDVIGTEAEIRDTFAGAASFNADPVTDPRCSTTGCPTWTARSGTDHLGGGRIRGHLARRMLQKLGCRVELAVDGREAVEKVARVGYDVVFIDCQMPDLDGIDAAPAIRRAETGGRCTPIVAMTAHVLGGDRERCLAAGMDDYIGKPIAARISSGSWPRRWM